MTDFLTAVFHLSAGESPKLLNKYKFSECRMLLMYYWRVNYANLILHKSGPFWVISLLQ